MPKLRTFFSLFCFIILGIAIVITGCSSSNNQDNEENNQKLMLTTTTSTYDSGLLEELIPVFEENTGYKVQILSKGTGASLELGKRGDADILLVHAKEQELQLVEEGYFVDRKDVMYNDFVIVGPGDDPASIKGMEKATAAFEKIAESESAFVSRGDNSGTNMKELSIWEEAGLEPSGDWYMSIGQGMGKALLTATEKQAYTLTDRGTYLSMKQELNLEVLVEGDEILFNQYGIMATNPEKHNDINYQGAKALIDFMTSEEGQQVIENYTKHGEQLFVPNA